VATLPKAKRSSLTRFALFSHKSPAATVLDMACAARVPTLRNIVLDGRGRRKCSSTDSMSSPGANVVFLTPENISEKAMRLRPGAGPGDESGRIPRLVAPSGAEALPSRRSPLSFLALALDSRLDGFDDGLIARAAAEIARELGADRPFIGFSAAADIGRRRHE